MITPQSITNYHRTQEELEEFILFAILVAGKGAEQQAKKLNDFLSRCMWEQIGKPFDHIEFLDKRGWLEIHMKEFKLGQYKRITHAFREVVKLKHKLKTITWQELIQIKGIGQKTAKFFVLHTQKNCKCAVLDTHILKWLDSLGYANVPKATPPPTKYYIFESWFLQEAQARNMTPADLDLTIWKQYAKS